MAKILHVSLSEDGSFFHLREFDELSEGKRYIRYYNSGKIMMLPDVKRLDDGYIRAAASDVSAEFIAAYDGEVEFDDDAEVVYRYWCAVILQSRSAATTVANFKLKGEIPNGELQYGALSPYQKVGLVNALKMPGYGLFMKQGTGKTAVAIMTIVNDAIIKGKTQYRAIVVCPPNVRVNWKTEFVKFAPNSDDIDVSILRGSQVTRLTQIVQAIRSPKPVSVIVCNYETLQNSWEALQMIQFDIAVLDEAHMIKSHKTKRSEYAHKLSRNSAKRLVLTGTPVANNVNDLYSLFEFMGQGTSGFRTYEGFRRYFGKYREAQHGDVFTEAQNLPILKDKLARYSFIISKEEALPFLPDKVYDVAEVEMTDEQRDAYIKLRDELVMEIETTLAEAENEAVAVNNILTQLLRLSQITSSFKVIPAITDEYGNVISPRRVIPFETNVKVEYIRSIISEKGPNDKTIIWSNWVEDIQAIEKMLIEEGENPVTFYGATSFEDRLEAERKFNTDPTCRWFIGNPQAGGTGLNLLGYPPGAPESTSTNCNHVVYVSQNWSAILREQSEDRCHRRGTREPVRITELVVPNTIDTIIATRVAKKRLDAASTLDIKDILSDIRSNVIEAV